MVAANAKVVSVEEAAKLRGNVWRPVTIGGTPLRVPIPGTLAALVHRHGRFLVRLATEAFQPVPPLSAFATIGYHSATAPSLKLVAARPFAAFGILKPDASGNRSFDTPRRTRMSPRGFVTPPPKCAKAGPSRTSRLSFTATETTANRQREMQPTAALCICRCLRSTMPLNRVEAIRRVLIVAPAGCKAQMDWVRRRLPGQELCDLNDQPVGLLNILPTSDWVLRQYVGVSHHWSTVTPVVWPGHDDRDPAKAEGLLRKAFLQGGLSPELVNTIEELDWRRVGFRAGSDLADRYLRPEKLNGRQYHVRVRFAHPVQGPLVIGAGRYRGLGVFAAEEAG